jgi:hypothetical protein
MNRATKDSRIVPNHSPYAFRHDVDGIDWYFHRRGMVRPRFWCRLARETARHLILWRRRSSDYYPRMPAWERFGSEAVAR